jgi:hypothetical protein
MTRLRQGFAVLLLVGFLGAAVLLLVDCLAPDRGRQVSYDR